MANEKYALLDTDFVSKMHLIRKDDQNKLIDKIMAMPNYFFYCHKQIGIELARHNIAGASEWFEAKVAERSISLYDDEMIMDELSEIYGELAIASYIGMLQTACDAYSEGYFKEEFVGLSRLDYLSASKEEFLKQLEADCNAIGEGKNQKTFKVQDTSKEKRMCKVPCEQVFDEMFNGKIEEMKTGNLKYI